MIDIRAITPVLIKNSVCIMPLIIAIKIEFFYFFLTHCTKLTKNHENKFASSIKMFFPNTYVTHLHETSRMSAEFVFRYGPKCMGGVILPILVLLHL